MTRPGYLVRFYFLALACITLVASSSEGVVIRPAPDFTIPGPGNKAKSLRSMRGQPVVLLVADSPKTRSFRRQLKHLREIYSQFASRQVVFVAAFKDGSTEQVQSNVPFAVAFNGAAIAGAYGVQDNYSIVIIGKDGNVDYQTDEVVPALRMRDVIQNSFAVQAAARKDTVR